MMAIHLSDLKCSCLLLKYFQWVLHITPSLVLYVAHLVSVSVLFSASTCICRHDDS